jgi:hypothetical protein
METSPIDLQERTFLDTWQPLVKHQRRILMMLQVSKNMVHSLQVTAPPHGCMQRQQ